MRRLLLLFNRVTYLPPIGSKTRITQDSITRITEDGSTRITE